VERERKKERKRERGEIERESEARFDEVFVLKRGKARFYVLVWFLSFDFLQLFITVVQKHFYVIIMVYYNVVLTVKG